MLTALIDFGTAVAVLGAWFALAFVAALFIGAFLKGPILRDYNSPPPGDIKLTYTPSQADPESVLEAERTRTVKASERAVEAAQRARARRVA